MLTPSKLRFRRDHRWTPSQLSAYLDGELSSQERQRVERHTDECPDCRGVLRSLRRMLAALAGRPRPEPVAERLRAGFLDALRQDRED